jgi:hypothetical protein
MREAPASLSLLTHLISSEPPFHVPLVQRQESTRRLCRWADCKYVVTVYSNQPPPRKQYTGHLYGRSYDLVGHWFKCVRTRNGRTASPVHSRKEEQEVRRVPVSR